MLMGIAVLDGAEAARRTSILAGVSRPGIALATPPLWTTWRPHWLPWYLESYINGVHTFERAAAVAFSDFSLGGVCVRGAGRWISAVQRLGRRRILASGGDFRRGGRGDIFLSLWLDALPVHLYAVYDYWHTSPNFFLARVGILLVIVCVVYAWCRWGAGAMGFSPLIQLGQTSLLVYWVHIEFVYGRFSILPKRAQTIPMATLGLLVIFVAMVLLSMARTRWKGRGAEILARLRERRARRTSRGKASRACLSELGGLRRRGVEASPGFG